MTKHEDGSVTITLNQNQYATLVLMSGYAAGAAQSDGREDLHKLFMDLAVSVILKEDK